MESSHTSAPKSPEHHFGLALGSTSLNSEKNSTSIVNTKLAVVYMLSSGKTDVSVTPLSSMIQLSTQYQAAPIPPSPRTETTTLELQSPEDTSKTGNLKTYLTCLLDWRIAHSMSKMQTQSDGKESRCQIRSEGKIYNFVCPKSNRHLAIETNLEN